MHEKHAKNAVRTGAATRRFVLFVAGAIVAAAGTAHAQAPAKKSVGGSVDLGYVSAAGNTRTTTLSVGDNFGWTVSPRLNIAQRFRGIYGEAADKVNANQMEIDVGADYRIVERLGLTAGVGFDRNPFAGIGRRFEEAIGVSWHIESARKDSLRFTGGILWTQQRNTADVETKFTALRVGMSYRCPIGASAYAVHAMEAIPNLDETDDWRFNSETSLIAALSKKFSLKTSFAVHYDNLPEPTFKKTDRILTAGIQFAY